MTLGNVRLVFAKEMRDTLRDRRTLFISVVLPLLLYPLLMIGFSQIVVATNRGILEKTQKVALVGGESLRELEPFLMEKDALEVVEPEDPEAALREGEIDAWILAGPDFDTALAERRQGRLEVHFDSTRETSSAAERKINRALEKFSREILEKRDVPEADIEPVKVEGADLAPPEKRGAKQLGPMLALLLVIMALSGAFYPAIDIMAGEKERGTMETLLVCPAKRTEIVAGKYLTVLTMTLVTALLNFASMAITFSQFAKLVPQGDGGMALEVGPLVAGVIVLALIPLAGLFSAVALALSTFARSYKEGQHYLTPLFVAVMPLAMVALVPATKLSTFAAVPVAGAVLLVRDLLLGTAGGGEITIVLLVTAACAAAAIAWTISMFNKESVLFRDPGGTEFSLFQRSRKPGETPGPGHAVTLAALALVVSFFVSLRLAGKEGTELAAFYVPQLMTLLLPLAAIAWYRFDVKRTLRLTAPPPAGLAAAVVGAPCALVLVLLLITESGMPQESLEPLQRVIEKIVERVGLPVLLVLPPIAEEIFFRGFVLSGLRKKTNATVAVLVTAAFFAVSHLAPAKYLTTGLLGIWLGALVVMTGSLWPAILAHLLNNALPLLLAHFELVPENWSPPLWLAAPAAAGLAAAIWLLRRARPAGEAPPNPPGGG